MSEDKTQELSAWFDGELPGASTPGMLDAVLADATLRERWKRYQTISDALAARRSATPGADALAERVRDALATEPVVLAPAPRRTRRRLGPVAGAALAASVALAAVLTTVGLLEEGESPTAARLAGETAGEAPARLAAVAAPGAARGAALTRMTWDDARPGVEARLNGYLLDHNEYLAGGVRGLLPYARVVGYDPRN